MPTGPLPKPTAIKRLESPDGTHTVGKRRLRTDEVQPTPAVIGKIPRPPKELSARARKTWRTIHQAFANSGLLTPIDGIQLAIYCQLESRYWKLEEDGKAMNAGELGQLRAFGASLGLDPSSRARATFPGVRPTLTEAAPEDDSDALARLRRRPGRSA